MAFCEKCGKELGPDGICDCQKTQESTAASQGQTASQEQPTPQGQAASQEQPAPKGQSASQKQAAPQKNKNMAVIIGAAAVVVLLVIIITVAGSSNYKTPVKQLVKLINKQSTDVFAYQKLIDDPISYDYTQAVYKILKKNEAVNENLEDAKEDIKDFFDDIDGFKVSKCDFVKAEKMKGSSLRDIQRNSYNTDNCKYLLEGFENMDKGDYEDLADGMDISVSEAKKFMNEAKKALKAYSKAKVTDGYEVTLRFYGKYDGDSDKTEKIENIRIIKVNGDWYIFDASRLFNAFFFNNDLSDVNLYRLYRYINSVQLGSL